MRAAQQIFRVRRQYNKWVGNQTLEDYALRFTATKARRWTIDQVAKTALGATAFMALEAIAAAATLNYGFTNTLWAMLALSMVIIITGFPICYYAAKYGLDIDLLTRSAGFGYLGSTITSLIYASFTFIFFAIEAAILASALEALLGIPPAIGYVLCAMAVIPIVTHGISAISKFQLGTQTFWLSLQIAALLIVVVYEFNQIDDWMAYAPAGVPNASGFDLALFGAAASIFFAMIAQIGEQVDYLRFMPEKNQQNRKKWWFWMSLAGPGWILIGIVKMLLGSFLAWLAISRGAAFETASDPTYMYQAAFNYLLDSPTIALMLAAVMVIISQMKINVTNAYAGSIAWSNFFSRLTHNHPGRVVWLVFNVVIALILMELGIYRALEAILGVFAIVALSWLSSLAADLMINKPLGLSPPHAEFKRAHLYDINPVGFGSMLIASTVGIISYLGIFGETARHLAHFISLGLCFLLVPLIAWYTRGKYYLARESPELEMYQIHDSAAGIPQLECCICENHFEVADISHCPAYQGPICSLCCSLDSRCMDACKPEAGLREQAQHFFSMFLPKRMAAVVDSRIARFLTIFFCVNLITAAVLALIYYQMGPTDTAQEILLVQTLWTLFFTLMIIFGVISWLFVLARESSEVAQEESNRQTYLLIEEIEAHKITDQSLQRAKEMAEMANNAKTRYLTGISHELRTPLQSMLGYAQLLSDRKDAPDDFSKGLKIIRRNGEYLTDLIEGLLDISKIEAGRLDIYRNRIRLPEIIDQLVQMFAPQAESKGLVFKHRLRNAMPQMVIADEKRLRQILINLLSNAIKYTEQGQIEFEISYRNQVAEFTVRDTGVGIAKEDMSRILDPFERIRKSSVPNVTGTGLGLTIVRLLTEVMGGQLKIESTPGEGSTFQVALMLSRVDTPAFVPEPFQTIIGYVGEPKKIMVVDDDPVHRGLISDLLLPLGFVTFEAKDAGNCLDMLETEPPDMFLLDMTMPDMDGMELAAALRKRGLDTPIIMVSADAQERHKKPRDGSHHDDYIVKPISNQVLLERIGKFLNLEWRYEHMADNSQQQPATNKPQRSPQPSPEPYPDHGLLRELQAYAQIGYSRGVSSTLDLIVAADLLSAHQIERIQTLAEEFRFQQLSEELRIADNDD